jgi:hypothetical protein
MSLLAPGLLAEVVIHLRQDGTYQIHVSKLPPDQALPGHVVKTVFGAGFDLAKLYGIQVTRVEAKS